jgi:2-C-methyl-D-erythritol 4-phosphate cytidylyltransferase
MPQDTAAVVLAAGSGRRLGGAAKALLPLGGRPVLAWSLAALRASPSVGQIVVVMRAADEETLRTQWRTDARALGADLVVAGGTERWLSSRAGVEATDPAWSLAIVHDAARPLLRADEVERLIAAVRAHGAALLAEPLADTLKEADAAGRVLRTVPRAGLWRAHTPQGARRALLLAAFARWDAALDGLPTDESALLERAGTAPTLVEARAPNPKLTYPQDLAAAAALLAATS